MGIFQRIGEFFGGVAESIRERWRGGGNEDDFLDDKPAKRAPKEEGVEFFREESIVEVIVKDDIEDDDDDFLEDDLSPFDEWQDDDGGGDRVAVDYESAMDMLTGAGWSLDEAQTIIDAGYDPELFSQITRSNIESQDDYKLRYIFDSMDDALAMMDDIGAAAIGYMDISHYGGSYIIVERTS